MDGTFQNFTPTHFVILGGFAVTTTAAILIRRRLPVSRARTFDRAQAMVAAVTWIAFQVWWALPPRYDRTWSWPLHLCDVAGLVAPMALWTGKRWSRVILHYWGLGLCTQALITPTLGGEPMDTGFWLFWGMHAAIVGPALYDVFARGYRPYWWPDAWLISVVTIGYLLIVLPIDVSLDVNYGYVGKTKPGHPTFLDFLGPWPHRVWAIVFGVAVVYFMMTWPWSVGRWWRRRREQDVAASTARPV